MIEIFGYESVNYLLVLLSAMYHLIHIDRYGHIDRDQMHAVLSIAYTGFSQPFLYSRLDFLEVNIYSLRSEIVSANLKMSDFLVLWSIFFGVFFLQTAH